MPLLTTDDGPRKLRNVWLGPKGMTLPWQWTYSQWAAVLLGVPAVCTAVGMVLWLTARLVAPSTLLARDPYWIFMLTYLFGGYGVLRVVLWAWRYVTFETPVGYQVSTIRGEWRACVRADDGGSVQWATPRIRPLSSATVRAMRWPDEHPSAPEEPA